MLLGDILRLAALRAPRRTAVIAGDRRVDYSRYDRLANRFANLLIASGVAPTDRVASLLFNSPEYGIVHFGSARAGSVLVHIPPLAAGPEIAAIVERTRPRVLVAETAVRHRLPVGIRRTVPQLIFTGGADPPRSESFEETLASFPESLPHPGVRPEDLAAITFTGGTTGGPKGTAVSHRARWISAATTALEHRLTGRDVVAVAVPMFHAVGLLIWFQAALLVGAAAVLVRKWDPAGFIALVERHRISAVFLVPVQLRDLLRSAAFDPERLAPLRNIGVGGAPMLPGLIAEAQAKLPGARITDHYGQSETGPLTILKPWESELHPGTVGQPAAGVELRIVDDAGDAVPVGTVGELLARGPFLMDGYYGDEEETARYFRDGSGWGRTGDLAKADAEGFITLVGRSRELIISGGFNIYPAELEKALGSHPAVADSAVFGVPDERWGEAPVAVVVREPGREVPAEALTRWLTARLARYKRPREIIFADRIPRNPSGKVEKAGLRTAYLKQRKGENTS